MVIGMGQRSEGLFKCILKLNKHKSYTPIFILIVTLILGLIFNIFMLDTLHSQSQTFNLIPFKIIPFKHIQSYTINFNIFFLY